MSQQFTAKSAPPQQLSAKLAPGVPGPAGPQGPPGPTAVSANTGNTATLGTDSLIYVLPVLPLAGGTMTGPIVLAADPTASNQASSKNYVDVQIADLNDVYVQWIPYTGPPQSFLNQNMTRDGDWTMVANKNTSDRPAPQQSGTEEDLLPAWTPAQHNIRATFTVSNQWTLNTAGWIDQYGIDVKSQNVNALHALTLQINGVMKDSLTLTPNVAGMQWQDLTPILVLAGAVITVTLQVTQIGNQLMYYDQQTGLFATPPVYCSLAQGSLNGAAWSTSAYDCHVMFIPGAASPDWDVVAYGGAGAGGVAGGQTPWASNIDAAGFNLTNAGRIGIGTAAPNSPLAVVGLPVYASNAAAITGGLVAGDCYTDGAGNVKVVF
jgi:hypothetical protein